MAVCELRDAEALRRSHGDLNRRRVRAGVGGERRGVEVEEENRRDWVDSALKVCQMHLKWAGYVHLALSHPGTGMMENRGS